MEERGVDVWSAQEVSNLAATKMFILEALRPDRVDDAAELLVAADEDQREREELREEGRKKQPDSRRSRDHNLSGSGVNLSDFAWLGFIVGSR